MQVTFIILLSYLLITLSFFLHVYIVFSLALFACNCSFYLLSLLASHSFFFSFYILSPVFIFTFILPSRERNWRTEKEPSLYRLNLFACQTRIIKWRQALLRSPKAFLLLCKTFFFFFLFFIKRRERPLLLFFCFYFIFKKKQNKTKKLPRLYSVFRSCLIYFFTLKYSFIFV